MFHRFFSTQTQEFDWEWKTGQKELCNTIKCSTVIWFFNPIYFTFQISTCGTFQRWYTKSIDTRNWCAFDTKQLNWIKNSIRFFFFLLPNTLIINSVKWIVTWTSMLCNHGIDERTNFFNCKILKIFFLKQKCFCNEWLTIHLCGFYKILYENVTFWPLICFVIVCIYSIYFISSNDAN